MYGVWQDGIKIGAVGYEGHGTIGPAVVADGITYHVTAKHIFPQEMHGSIRNRHSLDFCCIRGNAQAISPVELWDGDEYDPVRKFGAATGYTIGYIDHVRGSYAKIKSSQSFAEPGDSGAAVVTVRSGQLVGILVGGTNSIWDILLASEMETVIPHRILKWYLN
jgi:hypothetical protein